MQRATSIQLPSVTTQFMELHLGEMDPVFATVNVPAHLQNEQQALAVRTQTLNLMDTPDVIAAKDAFLQAVKEFNERKARGEAIVMDPTRPESHSWAEIMSELRKVEQQYSKPEHESRRFRIKKWLGKLGDLEGAANSWLQLLPSTSWQASVFCGGLKVILTAAVRVHDLREETSTAIEQIPDSIASAEKFTRMYPGDIERYAKQLLIANLGAMQTCVQWFTHGSFKKLLGAVSRGNDYEKQLSNKVAGLRELRDNMDRAAMISFQEQQSIVHELFTCMRRLLEANVKRFEHEQYLRNLTADNARILGQRQRIEDLNYQNQAALAESRKDLLLAFLRYEDELCHTDLSTCLRIGKALSHDTQSRVAYIMDTSEVHEWVAGEQSATLLVNAQEAARLITHSSASFFSTLLISALRETICNPDSSASGIVLYWFCGEHTRDDPETMVANLLGQLLDNALESMDPKKLALPLSEQLWTFKNLKALFLEYLRIQLCELPVYCIFGTVSMYEDNRRVRALRDLWVSLDELGRAENRDQRPLKLIATNPSKCMHIGTRWDEADPQVLWVPQVIHGPERTINIARTRQN